MRSPRGRTWCTVSAETAVGPGGGVSEGVTARHPVATGHQIHGKSRDVMETADSRMPDANKGIEEGYSKVQNAFGVGAVPHESVGGMGYQLLVANSLKRQMLTLNRGALCRRWSLVAWWCEWSDLGIAR